MDEAFDGLDPLARLTFKKAIVDLIEENNTTIIISSHSLRELEDICDNLGLLYKGGILFESDVDTLKTNMFKIQISLDKEFAKEDNAGVITVSARIEEELLDDNLYPKTKHNKNL